MRTPQAPLHSGFGPLTTAREALGPRRLDGRVAVVTGGYVGVGLETTRVLAEAGATVIVPARTAEKARSAISAIDRVELESLDLFDPASIDAFAKRFLASGRPIHILVNNAGVMATPLRRDARGFESQLATNHLGHFQLTARLWPALLRAGGARVVSLSSRAHVRSAVDFDDPHFERRPYDKWAAYGQSKTANALFAVALDGRGQPRGIRAFSVHPGAVGGTDLMRSMARTSEARRSPPRTPYRRSRRPSRARPPASGAPRALSSTGRAASIARTWTSPCRCRPTSRTRGACGPGRRIRSWPSGSG